MEQPAVSRSEPAPAGAGFLLAPFDQEASTSRYTITVTSGHRSDPNAVIGYDPPLRPFFLLAFPDESGDDLALWLGTSDREYATLDALHASTLARGYDLIPLPDNVARQLAADQAREADRPPHNGPLAALLRHLQSN